MLILPEEDIVCQSSAVDDMLGLFSNIRFMRLKIKLVSAATKLICRVIFQTDAAELRRAIIGTQTESIHIQFSQLGKSVSVCIIRIAVTIRLVKSNPVRIVRRYQRSIGSHILLPRFGIHIRHR